MPVDSSIALGVKPFRLDDPLDKYAKYMGVAQAQRQFTMEDAVADAARSSGGEPEAMSRILMEQGQFAPAMQLRTQAAQQKRLEVDDRRKDIDQKIKLTEAAASDAMTLDHIYRTALSKHGGNEAAAISEVQPIHTQLRQKWADYGIKSIPESFNPQANFASIGSAKEAVQYLKSLAPNIHMTDTGGAITPTNTNPLAGPIGPVPGAQTIQKTAPPQSAPTDVREYEYAKAQGYKGTFQQWQTDQKKAGATNVTVNTGPMTPGKTAANDIDKAMLDATAGLMQLDAIAGQFKPEYQTWLTRGEQAWSALKEKGGVDLKNKEKKDLEDFSKYKRNAIDSMNRYIKAITGAAMTDAEAKRILAGLPSVGDGIFDGDSPTQFKSKLDDAMKQTKMAIARFAYMKRNGMSLEDGQGNAVVPLDRMPVLINERGTAIEAELKKAQPGADSKALGRAVRRQLAVEFGLSSD